MPTRLLIILPLLATIPACSSARKPPEPDPDLVWRKMLQAQQDFPKHDTDGDGRLSHSEVKQALIRSGSADTSDQKVSKVIAFYDFNKDGKISLRETQSGAVSGPDELIEQLR